MEKYSHERQTILPPQPSLSRRGHASVTALWSGATSFWRRGLDGLARNARMGIELLRDRPAPSPAAWDGESQPRMTEVLTSLRSQQQLCLAAVTPGEIDEVSHSRPTVARHSHGAGAAR